MRPLHRCCILETTEQSRDTNLFAQDMNMLRLEAMCTRNYPCFYYAYLCFKGEIIIIIMICLQIIKFIHMNVSGP